MRDIELLIDAAKAAGYAYREETSQFGVPIFFVDGYLWNPLINSGDALDLAVTLRLDVDIRTSVTFINGPLEGQDEFTTERHGDDLYAATRRAIVRAAAEIWRRK